jgi:ankyrin repeat protein
MKFSSLFYTIFLLLFAAAPLCATTKESEQPNEISLRELCVKRIESYQQKQNELNEALLNAAKDGDLDLVVNWIKQGADVNYADSEGYTALHNIFRTFTNRSMQIPIARELIKAGANPNSRCHGGRYGITTFGCDVDSPNKVFYVAMVLAAGMTIDESERYLDSSELIAHFMINSPFSTFCKNPSSFLLQKHEQVVLDNLLQYSLFAGRVDLAKLLLDHGANLDAYSDSFLSYVLCGSQNSELINFILDQSFLKNGVHSPLRKILKSSVSSLSSFSFGSPACIKGAVMTLKSLASVAVKNIETASEINSSAAHAAAQAPASQDPQILEDRKIREQQDREYEEAVAKDMAKAAALADQAEVQPVELIAGNEEVAAPTPSSEELRAIQLQAIEKRS